MVAFLQVNIINGKCFNVNSGCLHVDVDFSSEHVVRCGAEWKLLQGHHN